MRLYTKTNRPISRPICTQESTSLFPYLPLYARETADGCLEAANRSGMMETRAAHGHLPSSLPPPSSFPLRMEHGGRVEVG